jgi:putative membrane protein
MVGILARTAVIAVGLLSGSALIGSAPAQTNPVNPPAASGPATSAQPELNKTDRDFIDNAAHGGLAEIELSKLAQKSVNPDVRRFADRMITDHTKANARLTAIAQADGVRAPDTLDIDHQRLRDKLANEHDGTFDRDYAHVMVIDHNQAIRLFQQEDRSGRNPQLKEFARSTLPVLLEHHKMAVALASKVGATAGR